VSLAALFGQMIGLHLLLPWPFERVELLDAGHLVDDNIKPGMHYHLPWPLEQVSMPAVTEIKTLETVLPRARLLVASPDAERGTADADSFPVLLRDWAHTEAR
jgi:membrane protease subunit HflK